MSDNTPEDVENCTGLLDHKLHISNIYEKYYLSEDKSDVTLVVHGTRIPAHRFILLAESTYFTELLAGTGGANEIEITDVSLPALKLVLQYMYCLDLDLFEERLDIVQETLEFTQRYDLEKLAAAIKEYLFIKSIGIKAVTNCWYPEHLETTGNTYTASNEIVIDQQTKECISIEYAQSISFNYLAFDLREKLFDGYDIQVSDNEEQWTTIISYSGHPCNQEQFLYFPLTTAKFIRIVANQFYRCNSFKTMHMEKVPLLHRDAFICPTKLHPAHGQVYDVSNEHWPLAETKGKVITSPKIYFNQPYCLNGMKIFVWNPHSAKKIIVKLFMRNGTTKVYDSLTAGSKVSVKFKPKVVHTVFIEGEDDFVPKIIKFAAYFNEFRAVDAEEL